MKRLTALALVLICALLFAACSDVVDFTYSDGALVDEEKGITYTVAPICFEPIEISTELYGECTEHGIELYAISGLDTELWITEKYEGVGTVYCAEGKITLPDITGFEANGLFICQEDTKTVGIATTNDAADVAAIVEAFVSGEEESAVTSGERYKLKFVSDKYPGIYYSLEYYESDDGENYIYDRSARVWKKVGDVMYKYLPRASSK